MFKTIFQHKQYKKVKHASLALGLASVVLGSGCATKEEEPQFTADPGAFEFAVAEAITLQLYSSVCSEFGEDMEALAKSAADSWYDRNWAQTRAADESYSNSMSSSVVEYNGEEIALSAVRMREDVIEVVYRRLDQTRRTYSSVLQNCTSKLEQYRDGALDLADKDMNADLYLRSLVTGGASSPYVVPRLAGSLRVSRDPGRSQYSIERAMQEWNCANGEILTIGNQWPNEAYGIYCEGGQTIFVSCSWGTCETN